MTFYKERDALLEAVDYYRWGDILTGIVKNTTVGVEMNGEIIRDFTHQDFVLLITKQSIELSPEDKQELFFICADGTRCIISETDVTAEYIKVIVQDNFIQVYISDDNTTWLNIYGDKLLSPIVMQGFKLTQPMLLKHYEIRHSSYLTLVNLIPDSIVELYDKQDNLTHTAIVNDLATAYIFLTNDFTGKIVSKNIDGEVLATKSAWIKYGQIYSYSAYDLDLIYNGTIQDGEYTFLLGDVALIGVRNNSDTDYIGLRFMVFDQSEPLDLINVSSKDFIAANVIEADIPAGETINLAIVIKRAERKLTLESFALVAY
ncbi:MAG: hypothetical protein ATN35_02145 [Epulopiscium sp. Nele67-Bin004]|nr:MAG: hypothetical protein ATN35_02145 [Epulopiscium sp. Nele67-Bin004]